MTTKTLSEVGVTRIVMPSKTDIQIATRADTRPDNQKG